MSDYGLLLKNNSGQVQIDSTYKNFAKTGTGSGSITAGESNSLALTSITDPPLFVFKPDSSYFSQFQGFTKSGSNYTHAIMEGEYSAGNYTLYWGQFQGSVVNSDPTYGLIVYNSAGDKVFHSDDKYFVIVGVYSGTLTAPANYGEIATKYTDITVSDATNNYFIQSVYCRSIHSIQLQPSPPVYSVWPTGRGLKKISSTVVRLGAFVVYSGGNYGANYQKTDGWVSAYTLIEVKVL